MSFKAQVYRVLIASPSDLAEERQAATDAINEWNSQHAAAESTILLPKRAIGARIAGAGLSVDRWMGDWRDNQWTPKAKDIIPVGRLLQKS
jgi:hypothetical protein